MKSIQKETGSEGEANVAFKVGAAPAHLLFDD